MTIAEFGFTFSHIREIIAKTIAVTIAMLFTSVSNNPGFKTV